MKVSLCFIISYNHNINKEHIWKDWIEPNKDIINVYFHYDDITKITSPWIMKHTIPQKYIQKTSYYHIVPAYLSIMNFVYNHCRETQWFIMLTESCAPIISPQRFRRLFFENYSYTIFNWKKAWWNIKLHKRANLKLIKEEYHLANDPWFVIKREHVRKSLEFTRYNNKLYQIICNGGLANESIFAIILYCYKELDNVKKNVSNCANWENMSSSTSPYVFKEGNHYDITFIERFLRENKYTMFIRKVDPAFPDKVLNDFIYNKVTEDDEYYYKLYLYYNYAKYVYFTFMIFIFVLLPSYYFINIL